MQKTPRQRKASAEHVARGDSTRKARKRTDGGPDARGRQEWVGAGGLK